MSGNASFAQEKLDFRVQRMTAWKLEKVATTCTADLKTMIIQGPSKELILLEISSDQLRVIKLSTLYIAGSVSGPKAAPGAFTVLSEPQLPRYGDYVSMIVASSGKRYLASIHKYGKKYKFAVIPDTESDGVKIKWDLYWFRLSTDGSRFVGVAIGSIVTAGKKGSCAALLSMSTDGSSIFFINRPRWNGKAFEYSKTSAGRFISPIGIASGQGQIYFKAEIGITGVHAVYACNINGSGLRIVHKPKNPFVYSNFASTDFVSDDGKLLLLNDNGMGYVGAVTIDTDGGEEKAKLAHKSSGISCDGLYSVFSDSTGLGVEYTLGGEPFDLISKESPNYPAVGKVNNRSSRVEPPVGAVTCSPFGYLCRSNTDVVQTGEVYFVKIATPPPPSSRLTITTPVVDFGIVADNGTSPLGIGSESKTAISGTARIQTSEPCNPFSFSGKVETVFESIGDIPVGVNVSCMRGGFTYHGTITVTAGQKSVVVPVVATKSDESRLLAKCGIGRAQAWNGASRFDLSSPPFIFEGATMVPVDFLIKTLPCDYGFEKETGTARITFQDKVVEVTEGKPVYNLGTSELPMTKPAMIKDGVFFIPLRLLGDAFGATISFYKESQSVLLNFEKPYWGRESLFIKGVPSNANVWVNYVSYGKAPLTLNHLQPGRYIVKVHDEGYEPYESIVEIPPSPGQVLYFLQRDVPTKADLVVSSNPKGAYIYVDDRAMSTAPNTVQIDPGLHIIKVALFGYPDYLQQIIALAGEKVEIKCDLEALKAKKPELVDPKELSATIDLSKPKSVIVDFEIKNIIGVPAEFELSIPEKVTYAYEAFGFVTIDGLKDKITTQKVLPGDSVALRLAISPSEEITNMDGIEDFITIEPKGFPSWKHLAPLVVKIEGEHPPAPRVYFDFPPNIFPGASFDLLVKIKDSVDLSSCSYNFVYQASKLDLITVEEGTFLSDGAKTSFMWKEDSPGEVTVSGPTRIGAFSGKDGDGVLFKLSFQTKKAGETIVDCTSSKLFNSKGRFIEHYSPESAVIPITERIEGKKCRYY